MNSDTDVVGEASGDKLPASARNALMALVIGGIAAILDSTIVTIAIHRLSVALNSPTATIQWVTTAYLLALSVAIPLSGWAQAHFGGKRAWMLALLVFVVFSAACAGAWSDTSLIMFRVFQGFGAGLIMPLMQTMAMQAVGNASSKVMSKAVAAIGVAAAVGPIVGPVLGGVVLNWLNWRWMFLINVPLVAVGLVLAYKFLAADTPVRGRAVARLDVIGLIFLAPALAGILLGLSNVASDGGAGGADVLIPLLGGLAFLAAFVAWGLRQRERALVDITLLRLRSLSTASAILFTAGATLYAGMFLLPLYFQDLRGDSVLVAALLLIPQGVGALLSRVVAAKLTPRVGARLVTIAAFAVATAGTVPFALADANTNVWWLCVVLFVRGFGVGAILIPPMMTAYADVSREQMPHATMTTRITQQVGASFAVAIVAVVLQKLVAGGATSGFQGAFWWTVGISLVALIPALALRRETLKEGATTKG
ncbi:DHA2 family efflux MFS transporter permease subunit [Spelaeicoccus albus]|uniref:EmrB/QacA subfamily drug resistance transporter n=1 Tax=Spelaeicoccus albus TaxID=1280376 RepID=A0A7Z0D2J6_9MICO|nr:DHA2 family efflux MFS transporter permease subunit [Spelaeicoccus albus]NYI67697.1 EmrB/QacA subfamily drug resistance transporter [Spelaeicoccus albus]